MHGRAWAGTAWHECVTLFPAFPKSTRSNLPVVFDEAMSAGSLRLDKGHLRDAISFLDALASNAPKENKPESNFCSNGISFCFPIRKRKELSYYIRG